MDEWTKNFGGISMFPSSA